MDKDLFESTEIGKFAKFNGEIVPLDLPMETIEEMNEAELTAKVSDPKARKSFAARHNCDMKKDKTKAGYWACRINKYGHLWGGKTYPGYW